MIKFDPTLFHIDYVRLKKITSTYLYVSSDIDGHPYKTEKTIEGTYKKRKISKVRIHESVARQYFKNNSMKEFQDLGKFAAIAYYGDIVVSIEVQNLFLTNTENKVWVSVTEKVMDNIARIVPPQQEVYINGKDIFWINKNDPRNNSDTSYLSEDKAFKLQNANYLSLSKIGAEISNEKTNDAGQSEYKDNEESAVKSQEDSFDSVVVIKTIGSKRNISSQAIKTLDFSVNYANFEQDTRAVALLREAKILEYSPNRDSDNPIFCYSPVLAFEESVDSKKNEEEYKRILNCLHSITFEDNPSYLNLNFVLHAGRMIGEKYGYEETEILNVPKIIKETKMISFEKIYEHSRSGYPIELHPFIGLAWLFRFIHTEKDLNHMRDLTALFSQIFKCGFIEKEKVKSAFRNGKSEDDIMMVKYRSLRNEEGL